MKEYMAEQSRRFDEKEIERLCRQAKDKGRGSMQEVILGVCYGLGDYIQLDHSDRFNL